MYTTVHLPNQDQICSLFSSTNIGFIDNNIDNKEINYMYVLICFYVYVYFKQLFSADVHRILTHAFTFR